YRRAARAARRPDLMDKPSLQTASTNKLSRARAATPAPLSGQVMPTVHKAVCTSVGERRVSRWDLGAEAPALLLLLTAGYGTFLPSQPRRAMSGFRGKEAVVQPMISMSPGLQLAREKMPRSRVTAGMTMVAG